MKELIMNKRRKPSIVPTSTTVKTDEIQVSLEPIIKKQVFDIIGSVPDISMFRAKRLWDYNWRVNIWCEYDSETELSVLKRTRIAYSYFIRTDKEGNILNSDPELGVKQ
jgi:hypothetical protein